MKDNKLLEMSREIYNEIRTLRDRRDKMIDDLSENQTPDIDLKVKWNLLNSEIEHLSCAFEKLAMAGQIDMAVKTPINLA